MTDNNDKKQGATEHSGKRYDGRDKKYGDKKYGGHGGNGGGKFGDRRGGGDKGERRYDRKNEAAETPQAEPQEKKPAAKIKLRLDVKDVVRGGGKASGDASKPSEQAESVATVKVKGVEDVKILYEDNHVLVVVKPRNLPSQADSSGDPDLLSSLKKYLVEKYAKPGDAYLGLLHRLDRPTGGVMVFAKTSKAASRLSEQIRAGEFEKCYAAVTVGKPNRTGLVEHYLLKDEQNNIVTLAPSTLEGVKRAASVVAVVDEKDGLSLVTVRLLTGRTHQARVQLKALGSPIVGDYKYAGDKLVKCDNLALWAYKLVFAHPISGDVMRFIAAPPDEYPWAELDTDALVDIVRPVDRYKNN